MRRSGQHSFSYAARRMVMTGWVATALLIGSMGTSCESQAFQEASADGLATGIKSIFDGLVDGILAGLWGVGVSEQTTTNG